MTNKKTIDIELTQSEANLAWRVVYSAREELLNKFGNNPLTDDLGSLLNKIMYPEHKE